VNLLSVNEIRGDVAALEHESMLTRRVCLTRPIRGAGYCLAAKLQAELERPSVNPAMLSG
jgi:hypothetical protein